MNFAEQHFPPAFNAGTRDQRAVETSEQGSHNLFRVHSLNFYLPLRENLLAATRTPRPSLPVRRGKGKWLFLCELRNFLLPYISFFTSSVPFMKIGMGRVRRSRFTISTLHDSPSEREKEKRNFEFGRESIFLPLCVAICFQQMFVDRFFMDKFIHVRIWTRCIFALMKSSWWSKLSRLNETF